MSIRVGLFAGPSADIGFQRDVLGLFLLDVFRKT
jgi:hypothetical protein